MQYSDLQVGYQFPPSAIVMDKGTVADYVQATEDGNAVYAEEGLVPPMALAARAMAALSEHIPLPPGAIHVSQEFDFLGTVTAGDSLVSRASVVKKVDRAGFHLLTIGLDVSDGQGRPVLSSRIGFMLP